MFRLQQEGYTRARRNRMSSEPPSPLSLLKLISDVRKSEEKKVEEFIYEPPHPLETKGGKLLLVLAIVFFFILWSQL